MDAPMNVLLFAQQHRTLLYAACQALSLNRPVRPLHAWVGFDPGWLRRSRLLDSLTDASGTRMDDATRLGSLIEWAESLGGGFLLPVDNEDFAFVARHRDSFPSSVRMVPMPEAALQESITDKLRFARLIESMGLPVPPTHDLVECLDDPHGLGSGMFPVVVKQARSMAGRGAFQARDILELRSRAPANPERGQWLVQSWVPGEDVALTLLADRGEVFAVFLRRRWFKRRRCGPFSPIQDVEFFESDWLEELGREWVTRLGFTGIADFDLRVDFENRRAWFLECDPRIMGGVVACHRFGINVPGLLVERARSSESKGPCHRAQAGRHLSTGSVQEWLRSGAWMKQASGPTRTSLPYLMSDPLATLARLREEWKRRQADRSGRR